MMTEFRFVCAILLRIQGCHIYCFGLMQYFIQHFYFIFIFYIGIVLVRIMLYYYIF